MLKMSISCIMGQNRRSNETRGRERARGVEEALQTALVDLNRSDSVRRFETLIALQHLCLHTNDTPSKSTMKLIYYESERDGPAEGSDVFCFAQFSCPNQLAGQQCRPYAVFICSAPNLKVSFEKTVGLSVLLAATYITPTCTFSNKVHSSERIAKEGETNSSRLLFEVNRSAVLAVKEVALGWQGKACRNFVQWRTWKVEPTTKNVSRALRFYPKQGGGRNFAKHTWASLMCGQALVHSELIHSCQCWTMCWHFPVFCFLIKRFVHSDFVMANGVNSL